MIARLITTAGLLVLSSTALAQDFAMECTLVLDPDQNKAVLNYWGDGEPLDTVVLSDLCGSTCQGLEIAIEAVPSDVTLQNDIRRLFATQDMWTDVPPLLFDANQDVIHEDIILDEASALGLEVYVVDTAE